MLFRFFRRASDTSPESIDTRPAFCAHYGTSTVIANVEAGHVWDGHETLGHVDTFLNDPSIEGAGRQYDFHATAVGFAINGLGP